MDNIENMVLPLTDENGEVQNFVVLDAIEIEELGQYILVAPEEVVEGTEENGEIEVMVLKVTPGEDEDVFSTLDDEEEVEQVFAHFEERWDEEDIELEEI